MNRYAWTARLFATVACAFLVSGAAKADPLITEDRATKTQDSIQSLAPDQRSRFDQEKERLLLELGRGPDGKLLASAIAEKPVARTSRKSRRTRRQSSVVGAPIPVKAAKMPVRY